MSSSTISSQSSAIWKHKKQCHCFELTEIKKGIANKHKITLWKPALIWTLT